MVDRKQYKREWQRKWRASHRHLVYVCRWCGVEIKIHELNPCEEFILRKSISELKSIKLNSFEISQKLGIPLLEINKRWVDQVFEVRKKGVAQGASESPKFALSGPSPETPACPQKIE